MPQRGAPLHESMTAGRLSAADRQAVEWFAKVNSGHACQEELRAFNRWLDRAEGHRRAYAQLEQDWRDMDGLHTLRAEALGLAKAAPVATGMADRSSALSRRGVMAVLGVGGLAAGVAGTVVMLDAGGMAGLLADHSTGRQGADVSLGNGIRIRLDAGTRLSETVAHGETQVTLHSGRAFFTAQEQDRRLVVTAQSGRVEARVSQFSLGHIGGAVELAVLQGSVDFSLAGFPALGVGAGHGLRYADGTLGEIAPQDSSHTTAWLRNRLVFDAQPLSEVVELMNRYRPGKVILLDPDLRDMKISGSFAIDQTDTVLQVVTSTLPVTAVRLTDYLVVLRAA